MKKKLLIALVVLLGLAGAAAATIYILYGRDHYDASKYRSEISDGLAVGSTINFTLPDQNDVSHTIGPETKTLVVAWGRPASKKATELFEKSPELMGDGTMFVLDISAVPTVIRNKFVLPKLKKNPITVVLIYETAIAKKLTDSSKPEGIAIISLEANVARAIAFAANEDELAAALK